MRKAPAQGSESFDAWAIVELMGHRKLAGRVSEKIIAGQPLLRIDVPEANGQSAFTTFYGPGSIYSLTPTTEKIARRFAAMRTEAPVQPYELKALPQSRSEEEFQ
jgi:hypothetical protein